MKNSNRNKLNLIFSSFLIIGFVICSYFFSTLAANVAGIGNILLQALILLLFGLLLFYATRVGEGKAVKRFSLAVLLLVDLPAVLILSAYLIEGFPLHAELSKAPIVFYLATVALGYAIPYTFFSGFELKEEEEAEEAVEEQPVLEGGIVEELMKATEEEEEEQKPEKELSEEEKEAITDAAIVAEELSEENEPEE